ncbi:MAG: RNA polymerase subunit sigma-70 [Alphaproteobacteria bacterium]|nr:RNA polymerase subunit sigma-70 [Alphaproteobacteria bacterium]
MEDARAIAEETARASYGRLLAWISSRSGDVAAAEDALAEAFRAALEKWPETGAPDSPEAWLFTAARRKLIDNARRHRTQVEKQPALMLAAEAAEAAMAEEKPFPDERLKLLFACAHPAIETSIRTPLMLQVVLGLDAKRIASAFLVSPSAMSGRLVRAKRKIKAAGIPFEIPDTDNLSIRLSAVLEAIYAVYSCGWDNADGSEAGGAELTHEALYLARLITELLPVESEGWGLLSLMMHAQARSKARRIDGAYVPLADQNTALWDHHMIAGAEAALASAWHLRKPGPYQIEAAIQSAHAASRIYQRDTRQDIIVLYEKLIEETPTVGAHVGYAAALSAANRNADGLGVLDRIKLARISDYQAYWAVRAHILAGLGDLNAAEEAYHQAIGLAQDSAAEAFLVGKLRSLRRKK